MENKTPWIIVSLLFLAVLIVLVPLRMVAPWNFLVVELALIAFCAVLGIFLKGKAFGILITEYNTMSLSRTQMVLWTILIVGSAITLAMTQISVSTDIVKTLNAFKIPNELLGLIGITLTSTVGAAVVGSSKADDGKMFKNDTPDKAAIEDIFEGDEHGNASSIDLGKVQLFFFTVVGVAMYVYGFVKGLGTANPALPPLPEQLVILMGMSHAGYLANKLPNRTTDEQVADAAQQAAGAKAQQQQAPAVVGAQPGQPVAPPMPPPA